jgi:signal transduction histidine kinase
MEERAAALEREREEHALRAAQDERARIARELHDVVAHHLSVVAVQAGAARLVAEERPEDARAALARIEDVSRNALAEMRRLLGVLRSPETGSDRSPQPGLGGLESLLEPVRRAGIRVVTEVRGEPRPLPAELDLTAFRIVQEAVTNTLRHSGATALRVVVGYGDDDLQIEVVDDGSGPAPDPRDRGNGQGIRGMRERAAMFGGSIDAGVEAGGFAVRARLPIPGAGAG